MKLNKLSIVKGVKNSPFLFGLHIPLTAEDFDRLMEFCRVVGWRLIINLNLQYRDGGRWNSSNAEMWMDYAVDKGYAFDFGLGYGK